jgi:hemerythrin-like domain-containing protein
MNNEVYRLCTKDVESFLTNKEHLPVVAERVRKDFSCMESLGYFVKSVKEQLRSEKKASRLTIKVLEDNFKRLTNKTVQLERGKVFLRLETQQYGL